MKKIVLVLSFLCTMQFVLASEEVIFLDTTEVNRLSVPSSSVADYVQENHIYRSSEDDLEVSFSEEEMPENKALRTFYKFVDDRAVNNKLNKFTSSMIDNDESSD